MILKVGEERSKNWSLFDVEVPPGFDVGAHVHSEAEELFYILEGELDLLAFEPRARTKEGWQAWESKSGARVVRGGPGSAMFVPAGCPHAFANPGATPSRMLFLVTPSGHEHYLDQLGDLLGHAGPPDPAKIIQLRSQHDIEQLTPVVPGRRGSPPATRPT